MLSLTYACVGKGPSLVLFLACVTSMPSSDARISQGIKLPFPDFPMAIRDFFPQVYPSCMYFLNVTVAWPNWCQFLWSGQPCQEFGTEYQNDHGVFQDQRQCMSVIYWAGGFFHGYGFSRVLEWIGFSKSWPRKHMQRQSQ